MTLDPVHFDGINSLVKRIRSDYDDSDQGQRALELWEYLDPLFVDGERILYPMNSLKRNRVSIEDISLIEDEYPTQNGLDSGTLNPHAFTNGLILDIGHAAMASVPSDLELHRKRTVISAVHSSDSTVYLTDDWLSFDEESSKGRVVQTSSDLTRNQREAVHAYALYLSESQHLLDHIGRVDDLLFLDGPLYPMGIIRWIGRGEPMIEETKHVREILEKHTEGIDRLLEAETPVVGFVKNMSSRRVVRQLRKKGVCPWSNDASFFKRVLSDIGGNEQLTFTNWFVSRFYDENHDFSIDISEWVGGREHPDEDYYLTYMLIYDPRDRLIYKAEAPLGFTRDDETREKLTRQVLKEVAIDGVPRAVQKADKLARISRNERQSLIENLERTFRSRVDTTYNDRRWGDIEY
ncbi:MAG: DNA double-strand break repair nuclease NurA [Halobacteria archaeon]|nr:DNA double-strand break repair nuclease NurA [Halobacteria archaeon]